MKIVHVKPEKAEKIIVLEPGLFPVEAVIGETGLVITCESDSAGHYQIVVLEIGNVIPDNAVFIGGAWLAHAFAVVGADQLRRISFYREEINGEIL